MIWAFLGEAAKVGKKQIRVLIAEDEFLLRFDAAESMRRMGWEVVEVSSADEALELLHYNVEFDLLVTDITMPGRADGMELARTMRLTYPEAKIVVMTANGPLGPRDDRFCDLVLIKPLWNIADMLVDLMEDANDAE